MIESVNFYLETGDYSSVCFTYYVGSERQSERVEFSSSSVSIETMGKAYQMVCDFKVENGIR